MGVLVMAYFNPLYNWVGFYLYNPTNQGPWSLILKVFIITGCTCFCRQLYATSPWQQLCDDCGWNRRVEISGDPGVKVPSDGENPNLHGEAQGEKACENEIVQRKSHCCVWFPLLQLLLTFWQWLKLSQSFHSSQSVLHSFSVLQASLAFQKGTKTSKGTYIQHQPVPWERWVYITPPIMGGQMAYNSWDRLNATNTNTKIMKIKLPSGLLFVRICPKQTNLPTVRCFFSASVAAWAVWMQKFRKVSWLHLCWWKMTCWTSQKSSYYFLWQDMFYVFFSNATSTVTQLELVFFFLVCTWFNNDKCLNFSHFYNVFASLLSNSWLVSI